ncbi:MAG: right-handed parallel beta-helix repeat-containing protein [Gemmataceae bacterium]
MNDKTGAPTSDFAALRAWLAKQRLQHQPAVAGSNETKPSSSHAQEGISAEPAPTLTVSSKGDAGFKTIIAAIRKAPAGARIVIRPGLYQEGLALEKPVELIGDGPRQDIIIENPDSHCISVQTSRASVRGLTLRSLGAAKGNKRSAVYLAQGSLVLEECTLSSDTLAALSVVGPAARAVIRRCCLSDSRTNGILVADYADASIEDCEFLGNGESGLLIRNEANPTVRHCRFHDGKMFGFMADQGGRGTIEDCEFSHNEAAGVEISGGHPLIRNCRFLDEKIGVLAFSEGAGIVENCQFARNGIGVLIAEKANPVIKGCEIRDGLIYGVSAKQKGRGTVESCNIHGCAKADVDIIEASIPIIRHCQVHDSPQFGIFVHAGGVGAIEECEIFGHGLAAIAVSEEGNPFVRQCRLRDGKKFGLSVQLKGQASVVDCDISGNMLSGVLIRTGGNPVIRRCKIHGNEAEAVRVLERGAGTFERCDLTGNSKGPWQVDNTSRVQKHGNSEL